VKLLHPFADKYKDVLSSEAMSMSESTVDDVDLESLNEISAAKSNFKLMQEISAYTSIDGMTTISDVRSAASALRRVRDFVVKMSNLEVAASVDGYLFEQVLHVQVDMHGLNVPGAADEGHEVPSSISALSCKKGILEVPRRLSYVR
jgi:hypothetical protein